MPFTYPTVNINSHPYNVYADIEDADLYIDASMSSAADTWRDTTITTPVIKARGLVSATRWLDSVAWTGDKTATDQEHAFPRKNLPDGVDSTTLPSQFISACIELAMLLVDNPDTRTDLFSPGTKAMRAGSVSLDFFRPEGDTQVQTPFPANVMALISQWLGGSQNAPAGALGYGTDGVSDLLDDPNDFQHGI